METNSYIVSARKYRPMTFDTVVGQSALTTTLMRSIQTGHLAHAYLFCGPRGVGKTTCARIFAKTINCLNPKSDGEACGECESCRAFNEGRSLSIYELDAASNNGVEEIKKLIEQTRIPPQVGHYKVFIIDEVHMLSNAAFNAFLKTLEEPPQYVIFILATTEKHKLLPTILSRCQIYDFNRMSVTDMVSHLAHVAEQEGIEAEKSALNVIAQKADGGMRDALSIFDQVAAFCSGNITYQKTIENLNVLDYDYYFKIVDYLLGGNIPEVLKTFNDIVSKGFEGSHFVGGLMNHLRNLMLTRDQSTMPLIDQDDDIRKRYHEQSAKCKPQFLYSAIRKCTDCDLAYKQSQNKRLLVEITLIEIAQLTQGDDTPAAGRSPRKTLKPIFVKLATKIAVAAGNATRPTTTNAATTATTANTTATTANTTADTATAATDAAMTAAAGTDTRYILAIRQFASQLPDEKRTLRSRLDQAVPRIIDETTIELQADNPVVSTQYQQIAATLGAYMAKTLGKAKMDIKVVTTQAKHTTVLTKTQLYTQLKKKYPLLKNMETELQLHL